MPPAGEAGPVPPPVPPSPASRAKAIAAVGWVTAAGRAVLAFLVMAALGQGAGFVLLTTTDVSGLDTAFKAGWIYYALFHRFGVVFDIRGLSVPGAPMPDGTFDFSYGLGFGLLLVTALAAWLLYRAGRAVAERAGGGPLARAVHGAKIAPVYAVLSLLGALFVRFDLEGFGEPFISGDGLIRASLVGAFFIPLALAAAFGGLGGWRTAPAPERGSWRRRAETALAGGWRMLLLGLALSFGGLLVNAVVDPDATAAYFRGASEGSAADTAIFIGHHVSLLPNQSMLVLVPAMGGCDGFYGSGFTFDLLCYWNFPSGEAFEGFAQSAVQTGGLFPAFDPDPAPAGYFLFLLVPLASVLLGGRRAAAGAATRVEAMLLGVASGGVFAILVLVGALVAGLTATGSAGFGLGFGGSITFRVGPEPASAFLLGLAWGVVGGGLGAAIAGRGLPARVVPPAPPPPPVPDETTSVDARPPETGGDAAPRQGLP